MKTLIYKSIALVLSFTLAVACSKQNSESELDQKQLTDIDFIIDWQPEPTYLGIYYAADSGFFEEVGFNVSIQTSWGAHQAIAAIGNGKYKIGTASGGATVLAASNNTPIKSFGVLYQDIPTVIYGLTSKTSVSSPQDLKGMRIGVYPGSITNDEFDAFLIANNIRKDEIEIVALTGGDIPILLSGEVDAVLHYKEMSPTVVETSTKIAGVNGTKTWQLDLKEFGVKSYGLNIIANKEAAENEKDSMRVLAAAVIKGYTESCNNIDRAVELFTTRFKDKDQNYVKASYEIVCSKLTSPIGSQSSEGWQETIELFERLNLLKESVTPNDIMGGI